MHNYTKLFTSLFALTFIFSACLRDQAAIDDALAYVPNHVYMVTALDIDNLMRKADFQRVKELDFYQEILANAEHPTIANILNDPSNSGIDIHKRIYLTNEVDPNNLNQSFRALLVNLAEPQKFEALLEKIEKHDKYPNYNFFGTNRHFGLAWNDEVAIFGWATNSFDAKAKIKAYFSTEEENSIGHHKNLKRCFSKEFDIANWVNASIIAQNKNLKSTSFFTQLTEENLKDNYLHSYLNFEKGKIKTRTHFFLKKALTNNLDILFKDEVKTDFTKVVPSENLIGMMTAALDLNGFNQLAIEMHAKGAVQEGFEEVGIPFEVFIKALSGDIMLATYKSEIREAPNLLLGAKIKKQNEWDEVLNQSLERGTFQLVKNGIYQFHPPTRSFSLIPSEVESESSIYLLVKDQLLFLAENMAILDRIQEEDFSTSGKVKKQLARSMFENIFAFVADASFFHEISKDFDQIGITDFEVKTNRKEASSLLNFEDQNLNSLKGIFLKVNEIYLKRTSS